MSKFTSNQISSDAILTRHILNKNITSDKLADNISINNLTITGELHIGNIDETSIKTNVLEIADSEIVLNAGLPSSANPVPTGGKLTVKRGNQEDVALSWEENNKRWALSQDLSLYNGNTPRYIKFSTTSSELPDHGGILFNETGATTNGYHFKLSYDGRTISGASGALTFFGSSTEGKVGHITRLGDFYIKKDISTDSGNLYLSSTNFIGLTGITAFPYNATAPLKFYTSKDYEFYSSTTQPASMKLFDKGNVNNYSIVMDVATIKNQTNLASGRYEWLNNVSSSLLSLDANGNLKATGTLMADGTGNSYINGSLSIGKKTAGSKLEVTSGDITIDGGSLKLSMTAGQGKHTITSYSGGTSLWIMGADNSSKLILADTISWDRGCDISYVPGVTGALGGQLILGQTQKNASAFTHGKTSLYTNGLERLYIDKDGQTTIDNSLAIGSSTVTNGFKLDVTGAIKSTTDISLGGDAIFSAVNGKGLRFWGTGTNYMIYMSTTADGSWGGKLDTSSDYNMYFKMAGGASRGFVFKNATTNVAQIDGTGNLYVSGINIGGVKKDTIWDAASDHAGSPHSYLPLVGGTITGALTITDTDTNTLLLKKTGTNPGEYNLHLANGHFNIGIPTSLQLITMDKTGNFKIGPHNTTGSITYKLDVVGSINGTSLYVSGVRKDSVWDAKSDAHSHPYDNYSNWKFATDGVTKDSITSGGVLNFKAGNNVSITRSAANEITIGSSYIDTITSVVGTDKIDVTSVGPVYTVKHAKTTPTTSSLVSRSYINGLTFDAFGHIVSYTTNIETVVDTNTASAVDNILDGSNSGTAITYAPYATQQAKLSFDTSTTAPSRTDRLNINGYLYGTKLFSGGLEVLNTSYTPPADKFLSAISGTVNSATSTTFTITNGTNITWDTRHTHPYDNYVSWKLKANTDTGIDMISNSILDIIGTGSTTISRSGSIITVSSVDTNTATAVSNILSGTNSGTAITYAPYTTQQAKLSLDTSATNPTRSDRLNVNGYLYGTKLFSGGLEVMTSYTPPADKYLSAVTGTINSATSTVFTIANGTNVSWDTRHTHPYDNYSSWKLKANTDTGIDISSGNTVDFKGGGATTITRSGSTITISSVDTNTNTITTVANGDLITIGGTAYNYTVNHNKIAAPTESAGSGRKYLTGLVSDTYGHITGFTTASETVVNTNTATAIDNILDGSNSGTAITYAPYTAQQTKLSFDTSSKAPSRTDRLNLNGYLYATKLYSGGLEVLTSYTPPADKYLSGVSGTCGGMITYTVANGTNVTWNSAHTHATDHAAGSDNQNLFANIANSAGTTQFSAASTTDSLRFAVAGNNSIAFTAATKMITITGNITDTPSTSTTTSISAKWANDHMTLHSQTIKKSAAKLFTFNKGSSTSVEGVWATGMTGAYAVTLTSNSPERHAYYTKTGQSITVYLDDGPFSGAVEVSAMVVEI